MNENQFVNDFNVDLESLSKLIYKWHLMNSYSKSEVKNLSNKILNNLYEEETEKKNTTHH